MPDPVPPTEEWLDALEAARAAAAPGRLSIRPLRTTLPDGQIRTDYHLLNTDSPADPAGPVNLIGMFAASPSWASHWETLRPADRAYLEAAWNAVPILVAEVRRLRNEVRE